MQYKLAVWKELRLFVLIFERCNAKVQILPRFRKEDGRSHKWPLLGYRRSDLSGRHIGAFTRHLADNAEKAALDLNRVFVGGGSAGGQLALAAGWGITSGQYPDLLDGRLHIRGIVVHYPAIGLSTTLGIEGSSHWVDPTQLLGENMPPVLFIRVHGTVWSVPWLPNACRQPVWKPAPLVQSFGCLMPATAATWLFPGPTNKRSSTIQSVSWLTSVNKLPLSRPCGY